MAEQQHKRVSLGENGEQSSSGKKLKAPAMVLPTGVVKQEPPEVQQQQEEGEVSPSSGAVAVVAEAEAMDEPQINLMFGVSRFHCPACLRPVKPPTFKVSSFGNPSVSIDAKSSLFSLLGYGIEEEWCASKWKSLSSFVLCGGLFRPWPQCEAGHVVCGTGTCRAGHAQACARASAYAACPEVDAIVSRRQAAVSPSPSSAASAAPSTTRPRTTSARARGRPATARRSAARPSPRRRGWSTTSARRHAWPVTEVSYAKPCLLAMPPVGGLVEGVHVLVGKEDGRVFLVSASPLGAAAVAVSLVCVRANGDPAPGVPQYKCTLWVESPRGGVDAAWVTFAVASKDMPGGFVAAEHRSFLGVMPDLLHDAPGGTPVLKVRIDKIGGSGGGAAAATARSPTPPASCSGRQP
ncbi:hypothetical protein EJB05_31846, partial [Eragrostis curvula]